MHWRIGNSFSVNILSDPWLYSEDGFHVSLPFLSGFRNLLVRDLFSNDTYQWNYFLLCNLFLPGDVKKNLKLPICQENLEDDLVWHSICGGDYIVKSGYDVALSMTALLARLLTQLSDWSKLWALQIPPKMKNFM